ncbi:uncharacterized protein LOC142978123 [Anticarsia gemmatalis]|uniref:uncharacterized protein LOC142978123 n=1 Tax=Anticarsia gemmatalis TaxID=129554 RepID=UPI003F763002
MEKDDLLLGVEMGRLEIEPVKINKNRNSENPFINLLQKRNFFKSPVLPKESKCTCSVQKKTKPSGIHKKKHNKILKEPILKILKNCGNNSIILEAEECQESSKKNISDIVRCDPLNLCTLVHNCNQLTISSNSNEQNSSGTDVNSDRWWKDEPSCSQESKEIKPQSSRSGTCSQQALNPPCDVTIDELASYFETLVHIPKKMSSMAEMMYI